MEGPLRQYADNVSRELCEYIEKKSHGIYNTVQFIAPSLRPEHDPPSLFIHRSHPYIWDDAAIFTLFLVDEGDLAYEPRLQYIEDLLRGRPEVHKLTRATAPDTMMKDMVRAEIVLKRGTPRLTELDSGQAKLY